MPVLDPEREPVPENFVMTVACSQRDWSASRTATVSNPKTKARLIENYLSQLTHEFEAHNLDAHQNEATMEYSFHSAASDN